MDEIPLHQAESGAARTVVPPVEIRIHGRGGQGNVVAAYLLAAAAIRAGYYAQAFPAFGAERRGAPVMAFVRYRQTPILRRCQVEHPAFLVIQDPSLLDIPATLEGVKTNGGVLINTGRETAARTSDALSDYRAVSLPATAIAEKTIGRPIPNAALLGALIALTGMVPMDALFAALGERFSSETATHNRQAAEAAANAVEASAWRDVLAEGGSHAHGH